MIFEIHWIHWIHRSALRRWTWLHTTFFRGARLRSIPDYPHSTTAPYAFQMFRPARGRFGKQGGGKMRYQNGDVSIDDDFARFGSKSYAIDKINSVDVRSAQAGSGCAGMVLGGIGAFGILMGAAGYKPEAETTAIAVSFLAVGGLLVFAAWRSIRAARQLTHTLLLTTSSAEAQATQSRDRGEVENMRAAIEAAMVAKR